MRIKIKIEGH